MAGRPIVSMAVILALLNCLIGCHSARKTEKERLKGSGEKIVEVILLSGDSIKFDHKGGTYNPVKRVIGGYTEGGGYFEIGADEVLYVRVSRFDAVETVFLTIGVLALALGTAVIIALATKESCPFVYSFDGEKYVFDAEPYGGAICPGLKKTDFSRLEHLAPVNGRYRLMLRNEVEETQHTDEMKLLVVDHPENFHVWPDMQGGMHLVEQPALPELAFDEKGNSLLKFIRERDFVAWQSQLPTDRSFAGQELYHKLSFSIPKPPGAKKGKLLVNIGTGLWGSKMIRKMLELRGKNIEAWYAFINRRGSELAELLEFIEAEQLYRLKLHIREDSGWAYHGFVQGQGPFINEDRVIPLDLSQVSGDRLEIRLTPPAGFWTIDYLAAEYEDHPAPEVKTLSVTEAKNRAGEDVTQLLLDTDNAYQVLPVVGDWAKVEFEAPPQPAGMKRSIFLKTSGWYEIHLSKDQAEQTELMRRIETQTGAAAEWAMEEYLKWRESLVNKN